MQDYKNVKDEVLAARAREGDGAAAEELLLRYKNAVRSVARKYFLAGYETDDLVQEGMIGLYAAIGDYSGEGGKSFKNFAYLCVTRRIVDVLRADGKRGALSEPLDPEIPDEGDTPEDFLISGESRAEFRMRLMRELSDFEFRVVTCYLDGMSYSRICEATGRDLKSVDNALARAKRKLQCAYGGDKKDKKKKA